MDRLMVSLAVVEAGMLTGTHGIVQPVPWWSFTKTILAAAALALVRDGRLALDDAVRGRPFTLPQLLQHRAGVANYGSLAAYHDAVARGDAPWPVAELLARTDAGRLRYKPGQGWDYSNIGYLFVRELIEETAGAELSTAIATLVLRPLGIAEARIVRTPADLAGVAMGSAGSYHPGGVYHGLAAGPLRDAALLLDRLMTGALLPPDLLEAMCDAHPAGRPLPGRPWKTAGYGLGLMIPSTTGGRSVIGHTGGGPGSVIAVYHLPEAKPRFTAAAFAFGDHLGQVEEMASGQSLPGTAGVSPASSL
jgi:CubicO group peptidase (beta-lactamase class C family)